MFPRKSPEMIIEGLGSGASLNVSLFSFLGENIGRKVCAHSQRGTGLQPRDSHAATGVSEPTDGRQGRTQLSHLLRLIQPFPGAGTAAWRGGALEPGPLGEGPPWFPAPGCVFPPVFLTPSRSSSSQQPHTLFSFFPLIFLPSIHSCLHSFIQFLVERLLVLTLF